MENLNTAELIGKIRDQRKLVEGEIAHLVETLTDGRMNDAQAGAFAMAVLCRGLDDDASVALTKSMRDSGVKLSWDVDGQIVDKHSTGGVGDCVSLALAPILASAGYFVPMISGRGLGHTGGTLDKLEAIEGFRTDIPIENMQTQLRQIGVVMAGQTAALVPADKRLYAIRDVTGSVPSPELITASILSKKLAAGLETLVLDVKVGTGAFMTDTGKARALAERLVRTANALGVPTTARITAMDIPLASSAGNAVEVRDIIALLEGDISTPLYEVTSALCESLGMRSSEVEASVSSGRAMTYFEKMCKAQGASGDVVEIKKTLPVAPFTADILLETDEDFHGFDAYEVGMAVIGLGGGRTRQDDQIDPSVGISHIASPAHLSKGDRLARVHARNEDDLHRAKEKLTQAKRETASAYSWVIEDIK